MRGRQFVCLFAVLLSATVVSAEENASTGPHILHAKLKPVAWAAKYVTFSGPDRRIGVHQLVPHTIVFDAAGRQVVEKNGYDGKGIGWIEAALKKEAPENAPRLMDFARDLATPEGGAFPPVLPPGEPVVVVFGAVWCAPCRALKADLEKVPGITILDIDVNQANMNWTQVMEAVKSQAPH